MDLRSKLLIVAGGGLILIAFLLLVAIPLFQSNNSDSPALDALPQLVSPSSLTPLPSDTGQNVPTPQTGTIRELDTTAEASLSMEENSQRAEIERVSRLFAERYGSYSNYSNFSNLDALESFSTASMTAYINATIRAQQQSNISSYYGVTTRVLRVIIDNYQQQNKATVSISVQQEVQDGLNSDIVKSIRDGRVELVYQNGSWLVNGIYYNN